MNAPRSGRRCPPPFISLFCLCLFFLLCRLFFFTFGWVPPPPSFLMWCGTFNLAPFPCPPPLPSVCAFQSCSPVGDAAGCSSHFCGASQALTPTQRPGAFARHRAAARVWVAPPFLSRIRAGAVPPPQPVGALSRGFPRPGVVPGYGCRGGGGTPGGHPPPLLARNPAPPDLGIPSTRRDAPRRSLLFTLRACVCAWTG